MRQWTWTYRLVGIAVIPALLWLASCGGSGGGGLLPGLIIQASSAPTPLPDGAMPGSQYPSEIVISTPNTRINSISVIVALTHDRAQDLDLLLVGPTGIKLMLMSDCLGDWNFNNQFISFSNASSTPVPITTMAPPGMAFQPTDNDPGGALDPFYPPAPGGLYSLNLSDFIGTDPNGTWQLYVYDDEFNATPLGEMGGWQIWLNTDP